jgi:hypothetical protein
MIKWGWASGGRPGAYPPINPRRARVPTSAKIESDQLHKRHRDFLIMESKVRQSDLELAVARIRSGEVVKKPRRK